MPLRLCSYPRCSELVKAGCCEAHGGRRGTQKRADEWRGSAHARGYDRQWQAFRVRYLQRHPVCVDCKREFATEPHHKAKLREHPELKYDEDNLMALCKGCHWIRTARGE